MWDVFHRVAAWRNGRMTAVDVFAAVEVLVVVEDLHFFGPPDLRFFFTTFLCWRFDALSDLFHAL
jgi:hypothetical protein